MYKHLLLNCNERSFQARAIIIFHEYNGPNNWHKAIVQANNKKWLPCIFIFFLFLNKNKKNIQDKVKEAFKTIHWSECIKRYKILPSVK